MIEARVGKLCRRPLRAAGLGAIRRAIGEADPPLRAEVARRVGDGLGCYDTLGRPKLMSCRVGLLRLHRAGLIALPVARNGNGNSVGLLKQPDAWPAQQPLAGSAGQLGGLRLEPVTDKVASRLWNGLIERWHHLGYTPLPGAQLRYLIQWDHRVLGALGFVAAAWKVAARDRWIGWERTEREAHLGPVLHKCPLPHPALGAGEEPRLEGLGARRDAGGEDFAARYGERQVPLATFVETPRHQGTCYRAANWRYLGETAGRDKRDRRHRADLPRKAVYAHPPAGDFRTGCWPNSVTSPRWAFPRPAAAGRKPAPPTACSTTRRPPLRRCPPRIAPAP